MCLSFDVAAKLLHQSWNQRTPDAANCRPNRAKHARAFSPEDFMPFVEREERRDDARLNVARFKAMFAHKVKKHG